MTFLAKAIAPPIVKHGYSEHIEQYRGLCALMVMVSHGFVHPGMLLDNFTWPEYLEYIGAGYLSVLVFFCISGYVIGLNYDRPRLKIKDYLKKRAVRLYPIYLVSIILCIIVSSGPGLSMVIGNLLFLQNTLPYLHFTVPVYFNFVTWSLNYEVLYYLLFIALFFWRPKLWVILAVILAVNIVLFKSALSLQFIASYLNGLLFWLAGLLIAWGFFKGSSEKSSRVPLLSLLFLHLCQNYLGLGVIILHTLHLYPTTNINWLFDLPFCVMVICILTAKHNKFLHFNKILVYALPAAVFLYLLLNHRLFENIRWIMCVLFWVLSLLFYFEKRISDYLLKRLTFAGKISYALYLFHVPVAYLVKKLIVISDRNLELPVKYFLWILITFMLSFLLEIKVQPVIKRFFFAK